MGEWGIDPRGEVQRDPFSVTYFQPLQVANTNYKSTNSLLDSLSTMCEGGRGLGISGEWGHCVHDRSNGEERGGGILRV